jgi:hypothetical protein
MNAELQLQQKTLWIISKYLNQNASPYVACNLQLTKVDTEHKRKLSVHLCHKENSRETS